MVWLLKNQLQLQNSSRRKKRFISRCLVKSPLMRKLPLHTAIAPHATPAAATVPAGA